MYRILCVVYNIVSSTLYLLFCVGRNANAKLSLSLVPYRMYQQVFSRCSSPVGNIKYFFFIQKQSHEVEQQCVFSLMTSYLRLGYDLSDQSSFTSFPFPSFGFVSPFNNFWMNSGVRHRWLYFCNVCIVLNFLLMVTLLLLPMENY
mmetsp:Transcript_28485/g.59679  ORF Transcript_28485/g.59679 Transcript_28485/m.59679 type:complete len:146 (-) Transcript_28485:46-483(-)